MPVGLDDFDEVRGDEVLAEVAFPMVWALAGFTIQVNQVVVGRAGWVGALDLEQTALIGQVGIHVGRDCALLRQSNTALEAPVEAEQDVLAQRVTQLLGGLVDRVSKERGRLFSPQAFERTNHVDKIEGSHRKGSFLLRNRGWIKGGQPSDRSRTAQRVGPVIGAWACRCTSLRHLCG